MQGIRHGLLNILGEFASDIERHRSVFIRALGNRTTCSNADLDIQYFASWYGLIGLHDAWSTFCKNAVIASSRGGVITRNGILLAASPAFPSTADPLQFLKKNWPKGHGSCREDGPSWHIPLYAAKAAQILQIANYQPFVGAILASANAPTELTACRNYLAHRHPGTENNLWIQALRNRIGATDATIGTEVLAEQIVAGGITVFEEWCFELRQIADAAIA